MVHPVEEGESNKNVNHGRVKRIAWGVTRRTRCRQTNYQWISINSRICRKSC